MRDRTIDDRWGEADDHRHRRGVVRWLIGLLGLRPIDVVGLGILACGCTMILINALVLQPPPHSGAVAKAAPRLQTLDLTGSVPPRPVARPVSLATVPAAAAPVAAPVADPAVRRTRPQIVADLQRELQRRGFYDGSSDGVVGPKTDAAIRDAELALGWRESGEPTEALLVAVRRFEPKPGPRPPGAVGDNRTIAVQRALARLGYGPLRPDGRPGAETRAAVQKFERDRNLPVTGEVGDRLVRELAAVTGTPIE